MKTRPVVFVFALLGLVFPLSALAEEGVESAEFERLMREGIRYYRESEGKSENYYKAIEAFQRARKIEPIPEISYNIGRAYHMLGNCPQALDSYKRYQRERRREGLRELPEVKAYMTELNEVCGHLSSGNKTSEEMLAGRPSEGHPEWLLPPLAKGRYLFWSGVAVSAAGLLTAGTGGILLHQAYGPYQSVLYECSSLSCAIKTRVEDPLYRRAEGFKKAGTATIVVGGSLVLAGLVLIVVDALLPEPSEAGVFKQVQPSFSIGREQVGLNVALTF